MAAEPKPPERRDGPTPHGGAYSILYHRDGGGQEIVEYNAAGDAIFRTYSPPPRAD